ncbi:MAG: Mur ligase family protein [Halieaceae bacterium]|jgi:UDP-N-acetylmuramyl tripeptide synthase|nr:Mur ligase family protein [Halieaceae bacterium]
MHLLDSRRLTGPSPFLSGPGAVIDVSVDEADRDVLAAAWERNARRLLDELDFEAQEFARHPFDGGVSLALRGPVDGLHTLAELNEIAFEAARDWIEGSQRHLLRRLARDLRAAYRDEERPRLMRLLRAARERGTPLVLDEDSLTLGTGCHGESWDLYELPHPDDVPWRRLRAVPTAMITGTNGKTTTVRLLASIAKCAGLCAGVSSTDWLAMGDELIDRSDYAGPGGARRVLRDTRCELAILETARGGLLRRGLAVERADVCAITNIAADHLGEYGIQSVEDLTAVKWSVTRALDEHGHLVLNAADERLMAFARDAETPARVVLFALDPRERAFADHLAAGGCGFSLYRGRLVRMQDGDRRAIVAVRDIPLSFDGAARHNIANALAAAAVADALGIDAATIAEGLCALGNDDNPGRANVYEIDGVTVLLDFAHNPAGLGALMPVIEKLPARRRMLVTGQAGDRSDQDIRDFALAAEPLRFDRILLKRMDGHARGRAEGEVAAIMRSALREAGYAAGAIGAAKTELAAARAALRWAEAGDLVVFLSHEKRELTQEFFARCTRENDQ